MNRAPTTPHYRVMSHRNSTHPWTVVLFTPSTGRAMHISSHKTEEEAHLAANVRQVEANFERLSAVRANDNEGDQS